MGKQFDQIDDKLAHWISAQKLFFVATAPLGADGFVNCSPKGLDSLRILGPRLLAYLDFTGSGAETLAHVRENGRIVLMWCAFDAAPRIVRVHGRGRVVEPQDAEWSALCAQFGAQFELHPSARSIVVVQAERMGEACGFGVPLMDFVAERDTSYRWADAKGERGLAQYKAVKNSLSIDALPALRHGPQVLATYAHTKHQFSKTEQPGITLLAGKGVEGDAHCGVTVKHRSRVAVDPFAPNLRQVHLLQAELFDELAAKGFVVQPGQLGENISTQGLDLLALPTDTVLHIGNSAKLRITGLRNPCAQIDKFQKGLLAAVLDRDANGGLVRKAGVMAVVESGGEVLAGDAIRVQLPPLPHKALERV